MIRINIIYFLRFLKRYLFKEIENFLKSTNKFFVFFKKKDKNRIKTLIKDDFEKKDNKKIDSIKNIIKKFGKNDLKKFKEKKNKIRDKTVSNFRFKNNKGIYDFAKNILEINNSCEKRTTQKISFSCRNSKKKNIIKIKSKNDKFIKESKFLDIEKIMNLKNSIFKTNTQIKNNFQKYENFIYKLKKAIDLLKNNKCSKIKNFEYKSKFLKEKLLHFEEDNNFLKDQLLKKENNLKFFKNEFSKFHKLILNKKNQKEVFRNNNQKKK